MYDKESAGFTHRLLLVPPCFYLIGVSLLVRVCRHLHIDTCKPAAEIIGGNLLPACCPLKNRPKDFSSCFPFSFRFFFFCSSKELLVLHGLLASVFVSFFVLFHVHGIACSSCTRLCLTCLLYVHCIKSHVLHADAFDRVSLII